MKPHVWCQLSPTEPFDDYELDMYDWFYCNQCGRGFNYDKDPEMTPFEKAQSYDGARPIHPLYEDCDMASLARLLYA